MRLRLEKSPAKTDSPGSFRSCESLFVRLRRNPQVGFHRIETLGKLFLGVVVGEGEALGRDQLDLGARVTQGEILGEQGEILSK